MDNKLIREKFDEVVRNNPDSEGWKLIGNMCEAMLGDPKLNLSSEMKGAVALLLSASMMHETKLIQLPEFPK